MEIPELEVQPQGIFLGLDLSHLVRKCNLGLFENSVSMCIRKSDGYSSFSSQLPNLVGIFHRIFDPSFPKSHFEYGK
jgi:hypothetical protein